MSELSGLHIPKLWIWKMKDQYGRTIDYLRISITDACNLHCRYCRPEQEAPCGRRDKQAPLLLTEEIVKVAQAGTALGIRHYRITGGEPLVRPDCVEIVQKIKKIPGVQSVGITTNGMRLAAAAEKLKQAGCDSVNVSLDTVDPAEFRYLTGCDGLGQVKQGIHAAKEAGLLVKINTVHQEGIHAREILEFAKTEQVLVRFIEMMPLGAGRAYTGPSNDRLKTELEKWFGKRMPDPQKEGNGPAVYEIYEKLPVPVGFISAIHGKFCADCSRVRLTSRGFLKLCLCYDKGVDLRKALQSGNSEELENIMAQAVFQKPAEHCFERPEEITEHHLMSGIGG